MAIFKSILGTFTGKLDNMTTSTWKGKNVAKRRPVSYNDANTQVQQQNRSKHSTIVQLGSKLLLAVRVGFKNFATDITSSNAFYRKNRDITEADINIGKAEALDMQVSEGSLAPVVPITESFTSATGVVDLEWVDNSNGVNAFGTDELYIGAYDIANNVGGAIKAPSTRSATVEQVTFPQLIGANGADVVVYYFFNKANSTEVSTSQSF